jgi:TatD DNase family protein
VTYLIDTHCHLNFDSYDEDREAVIERASSANVKQIIIPATDLATTREAIELSTQYDRIFASVGVHPNSTANFKHEDVETLETLANNPKVVAVGEIGLDYYWDKSPKEAQARALESQLQLATTLELPVIIHNRDASDDVMSILENWANALPESLQDHPGVLHSFSAPPDIAKRALNAGFYLGFTGPITFKNADELRRIAATVPIDRILVETDGPFLTPTPYRGKRNEPAYIPHIVDRLAALRQISVEEMGKATTENAIRLFHLPPFTGSS